MKACIALGLMVALPIALPVHAQSVAAGAAGFRQRCLMCHAITPGATGVMAPNLLGVVGRPVASTGFGYSVALKGAKFVWTPANLDRWLSGPSKLVPGTRMMISVDDPAARRAIIAYLQTLQQ